MPAPSCRAARRPDRRSRSIPGIVNVGADGTADVAFDIGDFAGTVRVMAVAWSKGKVGHASADVTVRDPVVLTATLPRFLLPGDRSSVHLDLDNVEGQAGDYAHRRDQRRRAFGHVDPEADVAREGARRRRLCRSPPALPATAPCKVSVSGPGGFALERSYALDGASAGANAGAAHRQADRQGRKRHGVERHVRRSRARHRRGLALGRLARRRSMRRVCSPRSTATRSAARSRSPAGRCRCSISAISPRTSHARGRSGDGSKAPRRHRDAADAAGFQRLVRLVERRRR